MDDVRRVLPILIAGVLSTLVAAVPAANADDAGPLYRLVDTAVSRLQTADPVAASKWVDGGPITDPQRANQVLDAVSADAAAHGVDPAYVRTLFENQIAATEGIEYARFGQWKFDLATAPTSAPDLASSRTAIDGFNTTRVDEVAAQWFAFHGNGCGADLSAATDAVATDRGLDELYRRALTTATRSYCTT